MQHDDLDDLEGNAQFKVDGCFDIFAGCAWICGLFVDGDRCSFAFLAQNLEK